MAAYPLSPASRATLDQMTASARDYWTRVDVDTLDPNQTRAIQATLAAVIWAYRERNDELGWWITALSETVTPKPI